MPGEYTTISRDTWAVALAGLASDERPIRARAFLTLLAAAPPGWEIDVDIDDTNTSPDGMRRTDGAEKGWQ